MPEKFTDTARTSSSRFYLIARRDEGQLPGKFGTSSKLSLVIQCFSLVLRFETWPKIPTDLTHSGRQKKKSAESHPSSGVRFTFLKDPRLKLAMGFFLIAAAVYMFFALLSYMFTGQADFSEVGNHQSMKSIFETLRDKEISNWLGLYGAIISHLLVFRWFGIASFFIPPLLFLLGFKLVFRKEIVRISSYAIFAFFSTFWLCLMLGYMVEINQGGHAWQMLGGGFGLLLAQLSYGMFGWGTFLILILTLFIFIIFYFNVTSIPAFQYKDPKPMGSDAIVDDDEPLLSRYTDDEDKWVDPANGDAWLMRNW